MFELCVHLLEAFFGCTVVLVEEGDMNKRIGLAYDFDFFAVAALERTKFGPVCNEVVRLYQFRQEGFPLLHLGDDFPFGLYTDGGAQLV